MIPAIILRAGLRALGAALPLAATPIYYRLATTVPATSTAAPVWTLPTPCAIVSWRMRSSRIGCYVTGIRVGQVQLLSSPLSTIDATPAQATATDLWDTAQTRVGGRRAWSLPALGQQISIDVQNNDQNAQTVELLLEAYSPPVLQEELSELLGMLDRN